MHPLDPIPPPCRHSPLSSGVCSPLLERILMPVTGAVSSRDLVLPRFGALPRPTVRIPDPSVCRKLTPVNVAITSRACDLLRRRCCPCPCLVAITVPPLATGGGGGGVAAPSPLMKAVLTRPLPLGTASSERDPDPDPAATRRGTSIPRTLLILFSSTS